MDEFNRHHKPIMVSRREAVKALIAVGGATAVSMLPSQWETPIIEVGALPAFAQCSPPCPTTPVPEPPLLCFTNVIQGITFVGPNISDVSWRSEEGWIIVYERSGPTGSPPCGVRPFPGFPPYPWTPAITVTIVIEFGPLPDCGPDTLPRPGTPLSVIIVSEDPAQDPCEINDILITGTTVTVVIELPDPCVCVWPFYISLAFQEQFITLVNGTQIPSIDYVGLGIFGGETAKLCG